VTTLLVAFFVGALVCLAIVRLSASMASRSLDRDFSKPQKFHVKPVPRIGGLGIVLGIVASLFPIAHSAGVEAAWFVGLLLMCAAPAFLVGLVHDFTDEVAPRGRLAATAVAAILAFFLLDAAIRRTDIPGLDWVVAWSAGALLVTVLAVTGIAHAINIIDGFNGLAAMCIVLMLAALGYVANEVGDTLVRGMALAGIGAVMGFFIWNFPSGLIFLGDGGAYFLGFFVAELSILLLLRNPEVSPLFALLVCVYPIFETLFSVYRRWFVRAQPASMPDGIHLHSLIYRRTMRWAVGEGRSKRHLARNSMTSPYLWVLCSLSVAPACLFWDNSLVLAAVWLLFAVSYVLLYRRIVRFRSPRWLRPWWSAMDRSSATLRR
jgi:UDP-N-acetylmuramyl pentapeptide phosphotransferase/UDP-N-acetylglucosamine-1-phosphate transferase